MSHKIGTGKYFLFNIYIKQDDFPQVTMSELFLKTVSDHQYALIQTIVFTTNDVHVRRTITNSACFCTHKMSVFNMKKNEELI